MNIFNFGKGYLTYALALVGIVYSIGGYFAGWHDIETARNIFWVGAVVFGFRRAVK